MKILQCFLVFAAVAFWAFSNVSPSVAAGAIYVSEQGDVGWCTNFGSQAEARKCAFNYCMQISKTTCQLELDCPGGWAVIAYGKTTGFGMVCNRSTRSFAAVWALASCVRAVKGKCNTSDAFDERGNIISKDDNKAMDNLIYAQFMLTKLGYYNGLTDGEYGAATKDALEKFQQTRNDLAVSGDADDPTVRVLIEVVGGESALADIISAEIEGKENPEWGLKSSSGTANVQASQDAKPAPAPQLEPEYLTKLKPEIADAFVGAFLFDDNFQHPGEIECHAGDDKHPDYCRMKAIENKRGVNAMLELEIFRTSYKDNSASAGTLTEDQVVGERMRNGSSKGEEFKSTSTYTSHRDDGSAPKEFYQVCDQILGKHNSEAICYIALSDRVVLSAAVPAIDESTPNISSVGGELASPDLTLANAMLFKTWPLFSSVHLPQ